MAITDPDVTPGELQPINEVAEWVEHLPAIETGVIIRAGDDGKGAMNFQARVLDARTRFLKNLVEGLSANGIILKGHLNSQEELDAIDTTNLPVGTAYFLDYALRAWNGTTWGDSGSLRGERGINLLGVWPDTQPELPPVTENEVGDAYIWKHDVHVLVPGPTTGPNANIPFWEALGIRGADGKDTYTIWTEQPGNEGKTVAQFIAAQKGEQGDDAYIVWKGMPGNANKTKDEWFEATRGLQGEEGPPKAAFAVAGTKTATNQLPRPGVVEEAWYVGIDLYVWVATLTDYVVIPGIAGKSAYDDWVAQPGNAGKTVAEFLESLKGADGKDSIVPGPKGDKGENLHVVGTVASYNALATIINPKDQDGYVTLDTGRLYMWTVIDEAGSWKDLGPFRGLDGKSAYEVWVDDGHEGQGLEAFWTFLKGKDGTSVVIHGAVNTYSELPGDAQEQWVYAVRDVSKFYAYISGGWLDLGTFGKDGRDGVDGKSLDIIKILTEEDPTPPVAGDVNLGKAYLDLDKIVWVNIQNSWQNAGKFIGNTGEIGPPGKNFRPKGMVANVNALPLPGNSTEGDAYVTADDKMMYALVDGQWNGPIDLIGPDGKEGPQGAPGALMPIKGTYRTMALLRAAHPTGALGDAYMIIDDTVEPAVRNLAIWSVEANDWVDTGPAGIVGPQGKEGPPGKDSVVPGPRGSQWLNLPGFDAPSNTFNGRPGDWAINEGLKVWYKSVNQGWVIWGQLVAGDVNSPLPAEGKVVRFGNNWVALPVDEVPAMVEGKWYVRRLIPGNTHNEGEWIELVNHGFEDVPTDTNSYLRHGDHSWLIYTAPTLLSLGGVPSSALGVSIAQLVNGTVPASQLPSYVDDVLEFDNFAAFPNPGEKGKIYIADDTNTQYRWTGTTYIGLVASPGSSDAVPEGTVNLYHTATRVRNVPLTGLSLATNSAIIATDTVITAFGKLQAQMNAFVPGFADVPTDTNLYLRKGDKTWAVYTPGMPMPANTTDSKQYVARNGTWTSLDYYSLAIKAVSATVSVDPNTEQFVLITNTTATTKTITLADGPKGASARALFVTVVVNGATGVVNFAPASGTTMRWNGGNAPGFTGVVTVLGLIWTGSEWVGGTGPVIPT